jgi:hypothetical protein
MLLQNEAPPTPYYNNVPIVPTGWVNVKVDMEVVEDKKVFYCT